MKRALSIRIESDLRRTIARLARERGLTQSELVREALTLYIADKSRRGSALSAYEAVADLVGCFRSGRSDLSAHTGEEFRKRLKAPGRA